MPDNHKKNRNRTEANILNDCLIALSDAGCLAWRNNTGVLPNRQGRPIRFGLCVGSSDIIGIAPGGTFFAVECKSAMGQPTDAQIAFIARVRDFEGRAGIARSAADAVSIALGQS